MTNGVQVEHSVTERLRRGAGRAAFAVVVVGLVLGLALFFLAQPELSARIFAAIFGLLMVLPTANVLAILIDEIRRRDWIFVAVAAGVLGLVVYSVVDRVYRSLS